ncbi:MAG: carotenoid oxygenase family protein [Acidimicrobiia bacterium]|nr:carotenoid oxygenase family protein [Acidimicrobiia bacterium]
MRIQVNERFESRLPADDTHPYRTGAWRPQTTEYDAWDLDVEGEIPDDLNGVYLRNTENPLLAPIDRYHPFDGDGMLHSMTFEAGDAIYRNRFVRTDGFLAEQEAGESLWAGIAEDPALAKRPEGWGARRGMKDASSTDVVVHAGVALTSFWQCGDLYRFDPSTLDGRGKADFGGRFPPEGVSAHTKVDEHTGELLFFNYSTDAPYMHYGELGPEGTLTNYIEVPLPGPRLPHDMAFTEHYAIVNDCPMFWDPRALDAGRHITRFFPDLPTRFGVIPRGGSTHEIRWFEAEPTFVLHWINAYEDGDEIVLDGFFEHDPSPRLPADATVDERLFRYLDLFALDSRPHRWRFDLTTGTCREEPLGDNVREFGMINGRHAGRRHRYSYDALPVEGWFGFRGVVKHDLETGREEIYELPDGVYGSETVMAPRDGADHEDDGYLITFTVDVDRDRSECLVLDAAQPGAGPLARLALPERICSGTHATWAPLQG